jgi:AmiR/NasT family two-component response regulator
LHDSAYARLLARLGSAAVIEQAKGIIMAQQGCTPEDAFALLRQVSQGANVKVHVLATQIVAHVTPPPGQDRSNVTAISLGAMRQAQP